MATELVRLKEQDAFSKLESWMRLRELPAWVFEKKDEPESTYLSASILVMDAFHHTVIIGRDRETIVIRTGGIAGVYEIYQESQ